MPCFCPLKGWSSTANPAAITFNKAQGYSDRPRTVPCGQCVGCRLERSRQWAIRCHHEASLHENNSFITLTFNNEHLPRDRSLNVRTFQLFMKRLRITIRRKTGQRLRFYGCGEYGDHLGRPHYHACIFGYDFPDKQVWEKHRGETLYRSAELEKLWPYGYSSIGSVTFRSAAYVARYIMKKRNGPQSAGHYEFVDDYGVVYQRKPEFTTMSRQPGVGAKWLEKYASDVYPDDFVIINGKRMRPPRYYDQNFELLDPLEMQKIKWTRKRNLRTHADNNTPTRLGVRHKIAHKKLGQLPRNHDKED